MLTIEGSDHLHSASGSQNFRRAGHGQERCERTVFLDGSGERVIERLWSLVSGHLASLLSSEQDVGVETRVSAGVARGALLIADQQDGIAVTVRSEEHTSELQSLMSISYAVLCLNNKNN